MFGSDDFIEAVHKVETGHGLDVLPPNALVVQRLATDAVAFAAVSSDGDWGLALSLSPSDHLPAIVLDALVAEFGVSYSLRELGDERVLRICLLKCRSRDRAIRELFASFAATLLNDSKLKSESDLSRKIDEWVHLFLSLQRSKTPLVIGLIGELLVLDRARDVEAWLNAWHASPYDTFDFGFPERELALEVKTTSRGHRIHELALSQLLSEPNQMTIFASVQVRIRGNGLRVGDLVHGIENRLTDPDMRLILWQTIAETCGAELPQVLEVRFDVDACRSSIRFYDSESVPAPTVQWPLPQGVSDLRFRSDLSLATPTNMSSDFFLGRSSVDAD
jgi:hypothetical protein